MSETYYVYVDWTTEDCPRPYYVGYGLLTRVKSKRRSHHHRNLRLKYGFDRRIELETQDVTVAKQKEIELIAHYKTYVHADGYEFGANYTIGGDGTPGRKSGPISDDHKLAISKANSHPKSDETKTLMRNAMKGRRSDPAWLEKMREVSRKRWQDPEYRAKRVGMKYNKTPKGDGNK